MLKIIVMNKIVILREYQKELITNIRESIRSGNKRILAVLPTGGGKTVTFSYIVKSAWERGRKCLILTDRIELMTQAGGALSSVGLDPIRIEAGRKPYLGGNLYTAMVETLARRVTTRKDYAHWLGTIDLLIIDESHKRTFTKLFPYLSPKCRVLGFTATPSRMGKKDQLAEFYTDLVVGVEIKFLVDNGYLAVPEYYGVKSDLDGVGSKRGDYDQDQVANRFSESKLYKGVFENWNDKARGTKTLIFSSNISNSQEVVNEFAANGVDAQHLDSNMSTAERESVLEWFHQTPDAVLSNVGILTTGFDEPSIETIILYRATRSLPLYLQMVGRGSRVTTTKSTFRVLDFGNNILQHGFWHETRPWSLIIEEMKERATLGAAVLKKCTACEAFIPAGCSTCPECGYVDEKLKKEQEFAELQLLDPHSVRVVATGQTLERRIEMAKEGLVKKYWVMHNVKDFDEAKRATQLFGWSPYWLEHNYERFWWGPDYVAARDSGKLIVKSQI